MVLVFIPREAHKVVCNIFLEAASSLVILCGPANVRLSP